MSGWHQRLVFASVVITAVSGPIERATAAASDHLLPPLTIDAPRTPKAKSPARQAPAPARTVRVVRTARRPPSRVRQRVAASSAPKTAPSAPITAINPPPLFSSVPGAFRGIQREGLASQGYRSTTATDVGPFGSVPIKDAPYSIYVVPKEFIENTETFSTFQLFRIDPFTQSTENPGRAAQTYVNIRGFNVTQQFEDGLRKAPNGQVPLEDKERVEIFTGLTGFLYGNTDPGGTINYVLKRPTITAFHEVTVGDPGGSSGYAHLDAGGPVDRDGRFGYRINIAGNAGQTPIAYQRDQRQLYSGAFDFHVTSNAVLQFDLSHYDDNLHGTTPSFVSGFPGASPTYFKDAPKADELFSQPWSQLRQQTDRAETKLIWDISSALTFRAGADVERFNVAPYNIYSDVILPGGSLAGFEGVNSPFTAVSRSEFGFVDLKFNTGFVGHQVTFGFNGTYQQSYGSNTSFQDCATPSGDRGFANCGVSGSLYGGPLYFPPPPNEYQGIDYIKSQLNNSTNNNILLGDIITLDPKLQVIAGINRAQVAAGNFTAPGQAGTGYDQAAYSPSASVLFKPLPWMTTYATYIQGLEQGAIVGAGYTNAFEALPPAIDQQYEVGVKIDKGNVLYTAALFDINKINQFSNNALPLPTFVQDGREVHKGVELSATGKLTENLTLVGGFTAFSARVEQAADPTLDGKRPTNVPEVLAKAYVEYRLPIVPRIYLSGGVNYSGDFAVTTDNTQNLPGAATFDVGGRYETSYNGLPVAVRVYATNVFNRSYWFSSYQVGDPRRIAATTSIRF